MKHKNQNRIVSFIAVKKKKTPAVSEGTAKTFSLASSTVDLIGTTETENQYVACVCYMVFIYTITLYVNDLYYSMLLFPICRRSLCADAYNAMKGRKRKHVSLYAEFTAPLPTQVFRISRYISFPSIILKQCTTVGIYDRLDCSKVCKCCNDLRSERGSCNPSGSLNLWYPSIQLCIEHQQNDVLTEVDLEDARNFFANATGQFTQEGLQLKEETKAQVAYMV